MRDTDPKGFFGLDAKTDGGNERSNSATLCYSANSTCDYRTGQNLCFNSLKHNTTFVFQCAYQTSPHKQTWSGDKVVQRT